ncbi:MAG: hypothetical protein ACOYO1_07750 [Bacteroidales bacterium]
MKVKPIIFDNILFGVLAPWRKENSDEKRLREILNNQIRVNKDNPEHFFIALLNALKEYSITLKIDHLPDKERIVNLAKFAVLRNDFSNLTIPEFFNKASEFYFYLIQNECIRIRAAIATSISKSKTNIDSEYQVVSLLENLEYTIEQIALKTNNDRLSLYVLNAVKLSLFSLYEEIKIVFPDFIGSEALTEYEIINFIVPDFEINKNIPDTLAFTFSQFLSSKEKEKKIVPSVSEVEKKNEKPEFIPNKSDFRTGYKGKLSFDDIRNVELFSEVEKKLYDNEYINLEYNFTNKHNKKKELAAIFKILISKKYFRDKNFKHHNKFRDADYRQYLDHRYNVDTSQQFRKCTPVDIDSITNSIFWLDNLSSC